MSLFSLRRFTADLEVPAASRQLDNLYTDKFTPPMHLVPPVGAGSAREASTAGHQATLIWPRPSLASARQAALDLARRWGQSKRRNSGILYVGDKPSQLRADDLPALNATVDANTAAIVLDTGCGGMTAEYCRAAASLCRTLHILLIIDGSPQHPPLALERSWDVHADIVIVDQDRSHGFRQPAFVVRTHTDGLEALARFAGRARSHTDQPTPWERALPAIRPAASS